MDEQNAVAVIGLAGSFPGARNVGEFWQNLLDGRETLSRWSEPERSDRFRGVKGIYPDATRFKRSLFGMNEADAQVMDPQIRKLLELAWLVLDDAGIRTEAATGTDVGVYVTAAASDHALIAQSDATLRRDLGKLQVRLLTDRDFVATRISYQFNLTGPSKTIQTACSSSLVAVHDAATAVLLGETRVALAGGVAIDNPDPEGYDWLEGGIGSATGRVRPFDARADGAVGGNGGGLVALKRLDHALQDGDRVYATILGTAVTNDGNAKVGFTAPSVDGHANTIRAAWEVATLRPSDMSYFEGHGTGTAIGDPIELAALTAALTGDGSREASIGATLIGSVKGNVGHLDTAAGVASLIKAVLMAHHRQFVTTPGLTELSESVSGASQIRIGTHAEVASEHPLIGVSSLGMGGTNAHVVIGGFTAREPVREFNAPAVLPISVADDDDSQQYAAAIADALQHEHADLAAVASTLQTGRRELPVRAAIVVSELGEAVERLRALGFVRVPSRSPRVRATFPGQTSYEVGVGRLLGRRWPTYAASLARSADALREFGVDPRVDVADPTDTALVQPAIVSHQIALLDTVRAYDLELSECLGHSLGEYTALIAGGVADPSDVLRAVARRGRLMSETAPGKMVAVNATFDQALEWVGPGVSIAAHNAIDRVVMSGAPSAIARLLDTLVEHRVTHVVLATKWAFHSALMASVEDDMYRVASDLTGLMDVGHIQTWNSSVAGDRVDGKALLEPDYWVRQMLDTVRWHDLTSAVNSSADITLELGSGDELTRLARRGNGPRPISVGSRGNNAEDVMLLEALGKLWVNGARLSWYEDERAAPRVRCSLPGHPMDGPDFGHLTTAQRVQEVATTTAAPDRGSAVETDDGGGPSPRYRQEAEASGEVAKILASVLGSEALVEDRSFLESGGDSLAAVQLIARIEDATGKSVEITALLSAERLSGFISMADNVLHAEPAADDLDALMAAFEAAPE